MDLLILRGPFRAAKSLNIFRSAYEGQRDQIEWQFMTYENGDPEAWLKELNLDGRNTQYSTLYWQQEDNQDNRILTQAYMNYEDHTGPKHFMMKEKI